jgi:hypothetical protein
MTQFDFEVGSSRCDDRAASSGAKGSNQAVPPAARGRGRRSAASLPPQIESLLKISNNNICKERKFAHNISCPQNVPIGHEQRSC